MYSFGKGVYLFIEYYGNIYDLKCIPFLERGAEAEIEFNLEFILFLGWVYNKK